MSHATPCGRVVLMKALEKEPMATPTLRRAEATVSVKSPPAAFVKAPEVSPDTHVVQVPPQVPENALWSAVVVPVISVCTLPPALLLLRSALFLTSTVLSLWARIPRPTQ